MPDARSIAILILVVASACGGDPEPQTYSIVVSAGPGNAGPGSVAGPGGLDCVVDGGTVSGTCSVELTEGSTVGLEATPASDAVFGGWGGACSGSGACSLTMTADREVSVTFIRRLALTVTAPPTSTGTGVVTSTPEGIACSIAAGTASGTCSAVFDDQAAVALAAAPDANSVFAEWDGACSGTAPCSVIVSAGVNVGATFLQAFPVTVSVPSGNVGSGHVTSVPSGISCIIAAAATTGTCRAQFPGQANAVLSAVPAAGSAFTGWTGVTGCGAAAMCIVPLDAARDAIAGFAPSPVSLNVEALAGSAGNGRITSTPSGIDCTLAGSLLAGTCTFLWPPGTPVQLHAARVDGSRFIAWSPPCAPTGVCSFSLGGTTTVRASFELVYALDFDGAQQFAEIPDAPSLDLSTEWTIEAWVRPATAAAGFQHFVSKWGVAGAASYVLEMRGPNATIATNNGTNETTYVTASPSLEVGVWTHVAATYASGMARIYLNGTLGAEGPLDVPFNSAKPLSFGREGPPYNNLYFRGALDEVRIWSVARTQEQISAAMGIVLAPPVAGLVGYWRLDEGTGQVIGDRSGAGNDGTRGSSSAVEPGDPAWVSSNAPIE